MPRFSITSWPDGPIRTSPVQARTLLRPWSNVEIVTSESGISGLRGYADLAPLTGPELPDELYLRELRDLDLGSAEEVARFVTSYGPLGLEYGSLPPGPVAYLRDLIIVGPYDNFALTDEGLALLGIDGEALNAIQQAELLFAREVRDATPERLHLGLVRTETEYGFWLAASWIRDLTTIALHLDELDDGPPTWESTWMERPTTWHRSVMCLQSGLEALMRPFAPRIQITSEVERDDDEPLLSPEVEELIRDHTREVNLEPPLVSLLAMQLYNHLVDRATFRTCANERCRNRFVVQRGRAKHGQHRKAGGVKFCSPECARAEGVRRWREAQRKKAKESE